ncbi:MAG TPA: TolC family protein [Vicinamibacterales bacterium]|nr:TolC family protein [Vicinamibacterales bacterium]
MIKFPSVLASVTIFVFTTLIPSPAASQDAAEQARLAQIARDAAHKFAQDRAAVQAPPAQTVPSAPEGPRIDLTLDEATARALERNLDIAVERLNPQTQDLALARVHATYRPTLTSAFSQQSRINPPSSTLNGGTIVDNDTSTFNAGIAQNLKWFGSSVNFQFNNNRQASSNSFNNYNPAFNSNFSLTYTQPVLRGLLIDTNRQQLRVTAIARDVSEIQLQGMITTTVSSVRNAYWELVYALQAIEVARGSLDLAQKLLEDNRARVEVGTLAPLDVAQSEAEVANRRGLVAQAEAAARTAEITLKRLIVNGTEDPLWRGHITPVDRPDFRSAPLDVEAAVRGALANRTDLAVARKTVESNDWTLQLLRNQRLPELDLSAQYGAVGLGGTQAIRTGSGITSVITGYVPGGYSDTWRTLTARDYPNWNVQLNLSYPIGQSTADANYARARVQRNQTVSQLRALELTVAADVENAAVLVESSLTRYDAARAARELQQQRLDAEQSRFDVGLSTNFFVVQAQRDLASAQITELRALLDYQHALVDFERSQSAPASRGAGGVTTIGAAGGGGVNAVGGGQGGN